MRIIISRILSNPPKKISAMAALISRHFVSMGFSCGVWGQNVQNLDCTVRTVYVIFHGVAGEGTGIVGHYAYFLVASTRILN